MSDRDYIAWSLLGAGLLMAVGLGLNWLGRRSPASDWSKRWSAARGQRLQHRLDKRLARGSDSYFEELRSIESAIADHERMATGDTPRVRFRAGYAVLMSLFAILFSFTVTSWIAPTWLGGAAPKWSDHLYTAFWPLMGVQMILDSFQPSSWSAWGQRMFGGLVAVIGAWVAMTEIHRMWLAT